MSLGRIALAALAVGYAAATAAVAWSDVPTTYAATSRAAAAAALAAGVALIAAGIVHMRVRPAGPIGPLATLLGVVWLAPDWIGWDDGWAPARSIAMLATPFLLPLLVHLVLAFPAGRVVGRAARVALGLSYAVTALYSVVVALVRDPFLDPNCWSNCTDNSFLVHAAPGLADTLATWWRVFAVLVAVLLAVTACWRLAQATTTGRLALGPVLFPAALAAGATAAYGVMLLADPSEVPEDDGFRAVYFARALTLACVGLGIAWAALRTQRTRSAIARLATDLGEAPAPGSLRTVLARSLGDDHVEVAYWLPGSRRYVDAQGRTHEPSPEREREATPIVRNGEPVAIVLHERGLAGAEGLEREIGAAARLAVDNERLRAEVLAQLEDLRASRARIVEAGDAARRRLERDLHDGAQQRLLALSYDLRLAESQVAAAGDAEAAALLAEAVREAEAALAELRDLAHGIHPAILTEAGLAPALATLADAAPIAVEVGDVPAERYPAAVETAAYVVVAESIEDAAGRGARFLAVSARREDGRLVLDLEDDGSEQSLVLTHVADRVGALGGTASVEQGRLAVELPCA